MTCHGFGGGHLRKKPKVRALTPADLEEIAKCISQQPGVLWCHVVNKNSPYKSWDFVWEVTKKCDLEKIAACASPYGQLYIDEIIINDQSWKKGKTGKHPKEEL